MTEPTHPMQDENGRWYDVPCDCERTDASDDALTYSSRDVMTLLAEVIARAESAEAEVRALRSVVRQLAKSSTGDIVRADAPGWTPAEADALRAATAVPTPDPETP